MAKHRATHRHARGRMSVGVLGSVLSVTIAVGGTAVGVLPVLKADRASADVFSGVRVELAAIPQPTVQQTPPPAPAPVGEVAAPVEPTPGPDSGEGRRIVFDQSDQRVWLIDSDESVERTYLVSGSRLDNLDPGTYRVQSKYRHATAYDASGTMEYFVRFATGVRAPIGFHSVPVDNDGELEQTREQLGTPLSAGCVRQWMPDAEALWKFAPVGTQVVVTP